LRNYYRNGYYTDVIKSYQSNISFLFHLKANNDGSSAEHYSSANPKVTAMPEAPKEPTLRDLYILLQAVDQRLTAVENDLDQRVVAVESRLEFA